MKAHHNQTDFVDSLQAFLAEQGAVVGKQRAKILQSTDPEGVHQMRIAVRRIRSVLRSLGFSDCALAQQARWLTDELGPVRDLDVLLARYKKEPAAADYIDHLQKLWRRQRSGLKVALKSDRYKEFEDTLQRFQQTLQPFALTPTQAAEHYIGKELKRTKSKGRAISSAAPDTQVHKLRLQCKRLRYLVEMFERHGSISLENFKNHARGLQNLLGSFVDERTAVAAIRGYAAHLTPSDETRHTLIECGRQIEAHETAAAHYRSQLPAQWSEFDATCTKKSLRHDLHT